MFVGILAGLVTCALWGLTFVAPKAVSPFNVWDITTARYTIFGLCCLLLMTRRRFRPCGIDAIHQVAGLLLGGVGYVGYFVSAAFAVKLAGPAIPPVIIGTMPIFLALIGNVKDKSVSWASLSAPLSMIFFGVVTVNSSAFLYSDLYKADIWLGIAASFIALVIWIVYGAVNSAIMRGTRVPDELQWSNLQGIGAALGSLPLLLFSSFYVSDDLSTADYHRFILWALVMGVAGSWLATYCWALASRLLPLALVAQLIVAETVFGLIFGFLYDQRWPLMTEATGAALQLLGVIAAIRLFTLKDLDGNTASKTIREPKPFAQE